MTFVVDCLNHTAQKELDYRTAMEKMYGNTPDISMFRFRFWETVWYFEPTAKYPASNFYQDDLSGSHGIAAILSLTRFGPLPTNYGRMAAN